MSDQDDSFDPTEGTVEDVRSFVRDCDDPMELRRVKTAEIQGKDRKTAKQAVDERLEALADDVASPDTDHDESAESDADAAESESESGEGDGSDESADAERGHTTAPQSARDPDTLRVRNPTKETLQLVGLKGELAPGEVKEYPVSDKLNQHIRENTLQVVSRR